MFTPQQIDQVSFGRSTFGGYDMQQVDEFLEPLTEDYVTLYKENALLKSKMRVLVGKLEEYRKNAGPALDNELKITLADMRSGNYSSAITRMEARVGSVMMSDVCRGLQAVLRGDENMAFWAGMEIKLTDNQRQILKRKAMQAPKKVHILSMIIMFCFILIYVVVMGVQIIVSLGTIF